MSDFYLVVLGFLAVLACLDLFVGVSNDAVNFLNSALGCRIARFRTTMWVASLGVLLGATFSSGMMEIARSGVFHPQMFTFNEIMIVFFAVMIADVLLLDTFNSLGLPTSTTVSIIFELLGSALAAALTAYTDAVNADTPNVSPSNKTLAISAACLADGTEVVLDQEQANTVNSFGVATWLNMNGFRLWGNNTAAYPGISDPKDRWFSVRRFLTWAANTFILTYFQKVDSPANKRLIEAIVDSENVRGNGFVARGVCARYEITFNEDENTTADLLDGKITFHQYITPFTPAEDIEDIIEFDPDALSAALN